MTLKRLIRLTLVTSLLLLAMPAPASKAQPATAPQATAPQATAQQNAPGPSQGALRDTSWFDSDSGELVPVYVKPVVDDSLNRDSRWLPKAKRVRKPATPNNPAGGAGGGGGTGSGFFGSNLTFGNLFGWVLLVAILVAAVALLLYAFSKTEIDLGGDSKKSKSQSEQSAPDEQTIERMKHLPAELRRTDVNLRSEAERLMKEGRYDQAIILLFAHQLLLLDRAGLLRLNRGKTNGKYIRETRAVDPIAGSHLRATVTAFERSYFGRHEIQQREFAELWRGNLGLEESVRQRQERAA